MAYNWREFLTFAENIEAAPAVPGPEEAALRSAVSRAYYAAFRAALELGLQAGFHSSGTGALQDVSQAFLGRVWGGIPCG